VLEDERVEPRSASRSQPGDRSVHAHKLRVMIVGTFPPSLGGTTILLKSLVDLLAHRADIELTVVNTASKRRGPFAPAQRALGTAWRVFLLAGRVDVVALHVSEPMMAWPILLLSRIRRRPLLVRWFGGADYRRYGSVVRRKLMRWMLRHVDMNLLETKILVRMAREDGARRVVWYPNTRALSDADDNPDHEAEECRRFVFVGLVRPVKGIQEIIDAGERLGGDVVVDVYGPLRDGLSEETFEGLERVRYLGVLPSDEVVSTMSQYDALLLPTYHEGEGYPGVVLEAFRAGLPVVCTRWQALPEVVDETCGILVAPRNAEELHDAMERLIRDPALFKRLREGAKRRRDLFSSEVWAERFVEYCRDLAERRDVAGTRENE
jgi:glycosyltransferase involved in cell wall biosynthesis